jgi:hypothetical protein
MVAFFSHVHLLDITYLQLLFKVSQERSKFSRGLVENMEFEVHITFYKFKEVQKEVGIFTAL